MLKICRSFVLALFTVQVLNTEPHNLPSVYEIVKPLVIDEQGRIKRDFSTKENKRNHHERVRINFHGYGRNFSLSLVKNSVLIPSVFTSYHMMENGTLESTRDLEHCYYHGVLTDQIASTTVIDTCKGIKDGPQKHNFMNTARFLNGFIRDDITGEEFIIESSRKVSIHMGEHIGSDQQHILYKPEHLKRKKTPKCGHKHVYGDDFVFNFRPVNVHKRFRRATDEKKYIEVVAFADKTHVDKYGKKGSTDRVVSIMNHVDSVYKTLNTRVALLSVITFSKNPFTINTNNAGETLTNFEKFIAEKIHGSKMFGNLNPDNCQLIIQQNFKGDLVGLAGVGNICGFSSGAFSQDHDSSPAITANTVAHELGHNLGFYHYTGSCTCPHKKCVMADSVPYEPVKAFSSCTENLWSKLTSSGEVPCVFDYPESFFNPPKCGNGYLENGEECDCGTEEECKADGSIKCCNPKNCELQASAECATGPCCEDCKFKKQGALCRNKMNAECDLEEYCMGKSSMCPKNTFVQDGVSCDGGKAMCYQGACKSHTTQCKTLWGENAIKADDLCFNQNSEKPNPYGNCGEDGKGSYVQCKTENVLCGKLQCAGKSLSHPLPDFPIIGYNRETKIVTFSDGKKSINCINKHLNNKGISAQKRPKFASTFRMGRTTLGKDMYDPTVAVQGTKCGKDKICIESECTPLSKLAYIKKCKTPCLNGGVCNNNGNCHCPAGFACPDCRYLGPGGSLDSGQGCVNQTTDKSCGNGTHGVTTDTCDKDGCGCLTSWVKVVLVVCLAVLPLCCLLAFLIYRYRENISDRWRHYVTERNSSSGESASIAKSNNNLTKAHLESRTPLSYGNPHASQVNSSTRNSPKTPRKYMQPLLGPELPQTEIVSPNQQKKYILKNPNSHRPQNNLPPIAGSSPRPGRLAQIDMFNQMDSASKGPSRGTTPTPKTLPP